MCVLCVFQGIPCINLFCKDTESLRRIQNRVNDKHNNLGDANLLPNVSKFEQIADMTFAIQQIQQYKYNLYFPDNFDCQKYIATNFDRCIVFDDDQLYNMRKNAEKADADRKM